MLTDEWPASSKFLFCARPGAARCSHRKKTSIAVVPDAATAKLQEMARGSHRESTQQVEKTPIANFRECCRYCRMLQDVATLNNCKTGSQRASRPTPLNSPSSILSKTPKLDFSFFFCNVARTRAIATNAHSRYTTIDLSHTNQATGEQTQMWSVVTVLRCSMTNVPYWLCKTLSDRSVI